MFDLSIIIPSYNTKTLLKTCLDSIYTSLEQSHITFEIIVVDNHSTDGSCEMIQKEYEHITLITNARNVGYGKANNQGIQKAQGEYILLLNSDIEVIDSSILKLLLFAKDKNQCVQHHRGVFVGGKLLNSDLTPQSSAGPFFTLPVVFMMLFLKGDTIGISRYSPNTIKEVDWVSGACLLGKKINFVHIQLFDESIFMYMDEIDLLYRAKMNGYHVFFLPDATFIHKGAASSVGKRTPVVNIYRGLLHFYKCHFAPWQYSILKSMLRWKAYIAITLGKIWKKTALISIYEEALVECL
jgi:GT2 family glycosyltransferase